MSEPSRLPRSMRIGSWLRRRAWIATALVYALASAPAGAQHPGAAGSAPPPPAGDGVLTVQVSHNAGLDVVGGLSIALYALDPNGNPGFTSRVTDPGGVAVFEGISTSPDIVYLVGASFDEIPFGERVTFAPGTSTARVGIELSSPTDRVAGVRVEELRARIDWMGDRVVVREILRLVNPGEKVIRLPDGDATRTIVSRTLPPAAADFAAGPTSIGDGLALAPNGAGEPPAVKFWGPLYPGDQRVEYQYTLPLEGLAGSLPIAMREAIGRVVIVAGTPGLEASGEKLVASSEVASDSGQPLAAWARARVAPDERLEVRFTLPETRRDPALVSIPRNDVWLELDDTRLTANVDITLQVAPGSPVAGTPESPLMRIELPEGAQLNGVAPEAEALGLIPVGTGFDVVGPIPPGPTTLAYSYRMPVQRDGVDVEMRFPREVGTLNVLIADSELVLESSRLHRRRPFRSGTRNFLHREAYHVSPDETVDLRIAPIQTSGLPRAASGALAFVALAGGVFFLVKPLLSPRRGEPRDDEEALPIQTEREAVYADIRDLDHDFETGKLDADDYHRMRDALRERAIELLRMERAGRTDSTAALGAGTRRDQPAPAVTPRELATGAFCPHCGGRAAPDWKFCTACGGPLNPSASGDAAGVALAPASERDG